MESRGGAKRQRIRYTETYGYDNAAEKRGVRFLGPSPVSQDHLTDSERITTSQCECCHSTMPRSVSSRTDSSTSTLVHDFLNDDHHKSLRTSIPPGLASCNGTYTYHQALQHRIVFDRLQPGSDLDPDVYTPVFLHDTLMLPGSLAQLIGKPSPLDILHRLTPAVLSDHRTCTLEDGHVTCITPSTSADDAVHGILFLGSGKTTRRLIKAHYRETSRRIYGSVQLEVLVPSAKDTMNPYAPGWRLEQRNLTAQVFIARHGYATERNVQPWTLNESINGASNDDLDIGFDDWTADGTAWQTEQPPPPSDWELGEDQTGDGAAPWDVHGSPDFGHGIRVHDSETVEDFGGW